MGKLGPKESFRLTYLVANFLARRISSNTIFNLANANNRDACFYPYWFLRESFKKHAIELNTPDINVGVASILFELHMDVQPKVNLKLNYLLLWETPQILPLNKSSKHLNIYNKIFTWNDALVDGKRYIKLNIPNKATFIDVLGFEAKINFCCLISSNKGVSLKDSRELYGKRVETIRWFEKNAPSDFDLYGIGWNMPAAKSGYLGKVLNKINAYLYPLLNTKPFPSYKGMVKSKNEVLSKYKYSICYENIADLPGYITEKIFDCFFAGCVPIYWGASNVSQYIPEACFIDRRNFTSHEALYSFLKSIDETTYTGYQTAIANFIHSDAAKPFYAEHFATTVVNTILSDLEKN